MKVRPLVDRRGLVLLKVRSQNLRRETSLVTSHDNLMMTEVVIKHQRVYKVKATQHMPKCRTDLTTAMDHILSRWDHSTQVSLPLGMQGLSPKITCVGHHRPTVRTHNSDRLVSRDNLGCHRPILAEVQHLHPIPARVRHLHPTPARVRYRRRFQTFPTALGMVSLYRVSQE